MSDPTESVGHTTTGAPPSTLPPGPRRIHDKRRGWRRLRRAGLAALTGLAGGGLAAWSLLAPELPAPPSAQPAAQLLAPLLLATMGLAALWRLSTWMLPLVIAGLLLGCGLPLLLNPRSNPVDLMVMPPVLTTLALPLLAAVLNRRLLRRIGLTGRLASLREVGSFGLLAGVAAPLPPSLLTFGVLLAAGQPVASAVVAAATLAATWAMALVSSGTALQASTLKPRRSGRWTGMLIALAALAAQATQHWLPNAGLAMLLLPHLLLCLHALQASPRSNARLGLGVLVLWALGAAATPATYAAGGLLAALPLAVIALTQHQLRDRDGWRSALDAQGLALAEWRLPDGRRHASARWLALTTPPDATAAAGNAPLDWMRLAHPRDREPARRALRDLMGMPGEDRLELSLRLAADGGDWRWHELHAHVPQRDRDGRARHLIMTLADISWRRTAEERERMSATLFQQAAEGLAVLDSQWRVVEVNPAYCEILHAPRETLIGRVATPLSTPNLQRSAHDPADMAARLRAGDSWSGQLQAELDDGGRHIFAARLSPVPEPDGTAPRWRLLSLTDLGESLRQQEQLRRSLRYDIATGLPNRD